jgi:uncharacterized protein (DUF2461 family)
MHGTRLPLLNEVDLVTFQLDLCAFNADAVHILANIDQAAPLAKDKAPYGQWHLVCVSCGWTMWNVRMESE